jgi:hypothetical protein
MTAGMLRCIGVRLRKAQAAAESAQNQDETKQNRYRAAQSRSHLSRRYHASSPEWYPFSPVQAPRQCLAHFGMLIACAATLCAHSNASTGFKDPVFEQIRFDEWMAHADQSHIHWSLQLSDPQLSAHQRLNVRLWADVDGNELAKRRGKGKLLVLVEVADERGRVWQNHQEMDLEPVEEGIKANDAVFSQQFFVLPGDYKVAVALYDTATLEHTFNKRRLHVPPLKNDPLPDAWRDLPAVEFIAPSRPPDSWYLPFTDGTLHLNARPREPLRVNVVVNLTPSERLTGSSRVQNRNFGALLPAAKILSKVDWGGSPFDLAMLDLSRLKVTYEQDRAGALDWSQASASLSELNPGLIDVKSLENRLHTAQFFVDEVGKRLSTPRTQTALIILSSSVEFMPGQEMRPIAVDGPANGRVFYIRYLTPYLRNSGAGGGRGSLRGGRGGGFPPVNPMNQAPFDQLAGLLKPLDPHLYQVATPEEFRKALAAILSEISKL